MAPTVVALVRAGSDAISVSVDALELTQRRLVAAAERRPLLERVRA